MLASETALYVRRTLLVPLAVGVALSAVACAAREGHDPVRSSLSMPAESLESLTVDLEGGVGETHLRAGCDELLVGTIDYDAARMKPEVIFTEQDGHGRLTLRAQSIHPRGGGVEWDLCVDGDVPLYLNADAGVGEMVLDLRQSQLRQLAVSAGVGEIRVELPTPDPARTRRIVEVEVDGGVGEVDIHAPTDAPLRMLARPGVGSVSAPGFIQVDAGQWVSEAWSDQVAPRIEIAASVGVGELTLRQSSAADRSSNGAASDPHSSSKAGTRDNSAENQ